MFWPWGSEGRRKYALIGLDANDPAHTLSLALLSVLHSRSSRTTYLVRHGHEHAPENCWNVFTRHGPRDDVANFLRLHLRLDDAGGLCRHTLRLAFPWIRRRLFPQFRESKGVTVGGTDLAADGEWTARPRGGASTSLAGARAFHPWAG